MKKLTIGLLAFIGYILPSAAQDVVKGYIFEDTNGNAKKERRESGIANVSVTNGIDVTTTNDKGYYELPLLQDMIVSVIKPSGYAVPLNEENQPLFYYIHKPKGSPENKYGGVAPTGKLPKYVNFPLNKQDENSNFNVLLFGDPQADDMANAMYFEKAIVDEVAGVENVAFGISLGDLGAKNQYDVYIHSLSKVGIPWYNVLGNHDVNDGAIDELTDETYEKYFGPANYAFNYANAHFIMLDDVIFPDPNGKRSYVGGFREDILTFVKNDLAFVPKDKLIVIGFHIPIYEFEPGPDQFREGDVQKLFNLLKGYNYTLSVSGHTHSQNHHFFTPEEGWVNKGIHHQYNPGATSGSVYNGPEDVYGTPASLMRDGTPKGYAYLAITNNTYTYEYKASGSPISHKFSVHIPKIVPQTKKYRGEIVVNFFQGSPRDSVFYRVDDGAWKVMDKEFRSDKFLLDIEYEWDHAEKLPWGIRPSTPLPSSHIWASRMPSKLPLGKHTLEVKAVDWLGRTYISEKKEFTIVPDHNYIVNKK
ncbi:calcineurin-like phosphoesterase family protein [Neptunitalea lumnitzerae]|nr:calcineurin-like phosphoesterase family protein [Neptunitalea sp. Y10]